MKPVCEFEGLLRMRNIRLASEKIDVEASISVRFSSIIMRNILVGRGVLRSMEFGEMALQQVLISKGALAMLVRTDEIAASKVSDIVVRSQSLLLLGS